MLTFAVIATAACIAVVVAALLSHRLNAGSDCDEIRACFARYRTTHSTQGAASSAKTTAAPRTPPPSSGNEVTPS
ncbi:hypothetical protein [Nonomuraea typhae]|uniref:hypothetical protein n=1 Tax=Nonomuraea typhae TaxID=2603600 RepID=UPI0012F72D5D|nr:hypothetical protein [Nonomuraea typhae]